jgi:hypothetical protein
VFRIAVQLVVRTVSAANCIQHNVEMITQDDKKVSVHLMITVQTTPLLKHTSFLPHYLAQSDCLAADRQGQRDTRLKLTPSVIPNSNYVVMVSDWNCLTYFCVFFVLCHHVTGHNTPIHNIISTAKLSISQKALGTLPEDGNVMPKHVGDTIHN